MSRWRTRRGRRIDGIHSRSLPHRRVRRPVRRRMRRPQASNRHRRGDRERLEPSPHPDATQLNAPSCRLHALAPTHDNTPPPRPASEAQKTSKATLEIPLPGSGQHVIPAKVVRALGSEYGFQFTASSAEQRTQIRTTLKGRRYPTTALDSDSSDLLPSLRTNLSMICAKEREEGMSKSMHTEAQMIGALKELEAGRKAEDVAREVGYRSTRSKPGKQSTAAWM